MITRRRYLFHKLTNAILLSLLVSVDAGFVLWLLGLIAGALAS